MINSLLYEIKEFKQKLENKEKFYQNKIETIEENFDKKENYYQNNINIIKESFEKRETFYQNKIDTIEKQLLKNIESSEIYEINKNEESENRHKEKAKKKVKVDENLNEIIKNNSVYSFFYYFKEFKLRFKFNKRHSN